MQEPSESLTLLAFVMDNDDDEPSPKHYLGCLRGSGRGQLVTPAANEAAAYHFKDKAYKTEDHTAAAASVLKW
ncbi:hypothetical protein EVAR_41497_1 [Eumeta japonica]|uniref:Uncharacterized protein n=1 Tax=Eumeta variegata TaxID=151549 RepID=A0A4C1WZQ2_EUMVA|nr:hypothetical protein EVAR_41497_1 [Eumeta japonica]